MIRQIGAGPVFGAERLGQRRQRGGQIERPALVRSRGPGLVHLVNDHNLVRHRLGQDQVHQPTRPKGAFSVVVSSIMPGTPINE